MNKSEVAIIKPSGICNGGTTTICLQYAKLGFDVYFKQIKHDNCYFLPKFDTNVYTYRDVNHLIELLRSYTRIFVVDIWVDLNYNSPVMDEIISVHNSLPKLEICHIYTFRECAVWNRLMRYCVEHNFKFDNTISLNYAITSTSPITYMDINAFCIYDVAVVPIEHKKKVIFTNGRVHTYKGLLSFLKSVDLNFFTSIPDFAYVHEGALFTFHNDGIGVSCPLNMLSLFDTTKHPKKPKDGIVFKKYDDVPEKCKFNIYPQYNLEDVQLRWPYYYVGICLLFGTKSGYVKSTSLFQSEYVIENVRERNKIAKMSIGWNDSLEYADMEKILMGIPVVFSKTYAKLIGFYDVRLIYDKFSDIPQIILNLQDCYDEVRMAQYSWLKSKVIHTNNKILLQFTKDF